jgi:hypothetical protein
MILAAAVVAFWFALAILFFYERFRIFNETVNTRYMVRKSKYTGGGGFFVDEFVFGWHTVLGIMVLMVSLWLFSVFLKYVSY